MATERLDTTGKRIRALRTKRKLTQSQLTAVLKQSGVEIGQSYVSEIERSDRIPSGDVVAGLARALNTTADYLLILSENPLGNKNSETLLVIETKGIDEQRLLQELAKLVQSLPVEKQELCVSAIRLLYSAFAP